MLENKITACMVIYNEERVLERCLKSIKNVVDEILIVHDGKCIDSSLEIAKKYGATIFVMPHTGSSENYRPFSFSKARNNWVLLIDADEFLSKEAGGQLPDLIKSKEISAYSLKWPLWNNHKNQYFKRGPFSKMQRVCLFRKSDMYMVGVTHFHPKTRGRISHCTNLILEHRHSYFKFDLSVFKVKVLNWARLEARQTVDYKKAPIYNISQEELDAIFLPAIKHPLIHGLRLVIHQLAHYIKQGLLISDYLNWKVAFLDLYRVLITHFYIYEYTKNKKNHN